MTSWGTPFLGTKTKVSGEHELKAGDNIALKMTEGSCTYYDEAYTNPQSVIDGVKSEFEAEGSFQPKYINVTFFPLPHNYFSVLVEVHAKVIHASPLVITLSWTLIAGLLIALGIVIVLAVIWYYTVETFGVGGSIFILVIVAIIVLVVIGGFRRKGGG